MYRDLKQEIPASWRKVLESESDLSYFPKLEMAVNRAYSKDVVYPKRADIFAALQHCSFTKTKVVLLGQDPYHGKKQAHGLSFSVPNGQKCPPSLRNIFIALQNDLQGDLRTQTNLEDWAKQGVLLLNTCLTVKEGHAFSHKSFGWDLFTEQLLQLVSNKRENIVFMLWGAAAQKLTAIIDPKKHLILSSVHPSPLSAYRGFLDCKHFSKCNAYLKRFNKAPIDWMGKQAMPSQQKLKF